jgi:hypothetical protein
MEKITAVLPKTFAFVDSCPPTTLSHLENACQFHRFLMSCWKREAPDPPYIYDVAAFEIACAKVDADPQHDPSHGATSKVHSGSINRCPNVMLLRCAYEVRQSSSRALQRPYRWTLLAVAMPPGAAGAQVFEVIPAIFDLLAALDDWIDPKGLDADPGFAKLLAGLVAPGLIEVRRWAHWEFAPNTCLGIPINIDKSGICVLAQAGARVVHIGRVLDVGCFLRLGGVQERRGAR